MKRAIFIVSIVLLALLAVTCENGIIPMGPAAVINPPPSEPGLVTLTINTSDSRARSMASTDASTDTNYYEVVFVAPNGTDVYRQTWTGTTNGDGGNTFTMTVAIADYDNSGGSGKGHAIIFAGRSGTDNTLLGVGNITATAGGTGAGPNSNVAADTTGVTFSIYPLSFSITGSAATSNFQTTTPVTSVATEIINTVSYPVFTITNNVATVATYKFNASTMVTAASSQVTIGAGTVYVTTPAAATGALTATATTGYTGATIIPNSGTLATALAGVFTVNIPLINSDGNYSKLYIQVGVTTVGSTTTGKVNQTAGAGGNAGSTGHAAGTWFIRGGINNDTVDPIAGGKGGAVLLKLENPTPSPEVNIGVTPTVSP